MKPPETRPGPIVPGDPGLRPQPIRSAAPPVYRPPVQNRVSPPPVFSPQANQAQAKLAIRPTPPPFQPGSAHPAFPPAVQPLAAVRSAPAAAPQIRPAALAPAPANCRPVFAIQPKIKVGRNEYSSSAAYRKLANRGLSSYQRDDEVRRGLRRLSRAGSGPFTSWEAVWDAALRQGEAPSRRRRVASPRRSREVLDPTEFEGTQELAEEILRLFPPSNYFYIGLGRSPTPIIAYLFQRNRDARQIEGLDRLVMNLPLSGFRPRLRTFFSHSNPHKLDEPLSKPQHEELQRHFARLLPSASQLGSRSILVIDYTQSARALIAATEHLQEYFNSQKSFLGSAPKVIPLALCVREYLGTVKATGLTNILVIPGSLDDKSSIAYKIGGGDYYDKYAEYGAFYITKGQKTEEIGEPNEHFAELEHDMYVRSRGYEPIP